MNLKRKIGKSPVEAKTFSQEKINKKLYESLLDEKTYHQVMNPFSMPKLGSGIMEQIEQANVIKYESSFSKKDLEDMLKAMDKQGKKSRTESYRFDVFHVGEHPLTPEQAFTLEDQIDRRTIPWNVSKDDDS